MNIRDALVRVAAIQAGLSITDPVTDPTPYEIKRAYTTFPDRDSALPDCPCWINSWTLVREDRNPGMREAFYQIRMQLFIDDTDLDVGADIATAFMEKIMDALDADTSLGGTSTGTTLRGGDPTLGLLEWAGQGYPGLDLFLDLKMTESKSFG